MGTIAQVWLQELNIGYTYFVLTTLAKVWAWGVDLIVEGVMKMKRCIPGENYRIAITSPSIELSYYQPHIGEYELYVIKLV